MPKLIKIRDEWNEKDILINIDDISVIELDSKSIIMTNTSRMYSKIYTNKKGIDDICEVCGYYETPDRKIEEKLMDFNGIHGRDNNGTIWSIPRRVTDEEINNPDIFVRVCKCKLPSMCGHVFKKSEFPDGRINYKCVYCGEGGQLLFNPPSSDS